MSEASSSTRPGSPIGELPTIPSARPFRFTWDAANRKPGPGSVSEATEGPGDYHTPFTAPTGYDVYNTSVQALGLGAFPPDWSSSTHGFHGMSYVLMCNEKSWYANCRLFNWNLNSYFDCGE